MKLAIERRKREAQDLDSCSFAPNLVTQGSQKGQSKQSFSLKANSDIGRRQDPYTARAMDDAGPRYANDYDALKGGPLIRKNDLYLSSRTDEPSLDESVYPDYVGGRSYSAYPPTATPSHRIVFSSGNPVGNGGRIDRAQYDEEDDNDDYCSSGFELNESGDVVLSTHLS